LNSFMEDSSFYYSHNSRYLLGRTYGGRSGVSRLNSEDGSSTSYTNSRTASQVRT
jgi:hypothetical protein